MHKLGTYHLKPVTDACHQGRTFARSGTTKNDEELVPLPLIKRIGVKAVNTLFFFQLIQKKAIQQPLVT